MKDCLATVASTRYKRLEELVNDEKVLKDPRLLFKSLSLPLAGVRQWVSLGSVDTKSQQKSNLHNSILAAL